MTENRCRFLCDPLARSALRDAIQACRERWPFETRAMVLLPDHLHALWSLPEGDAAYSRRWGFIKKAFTRTWLGAGGSEQVTSRSRKAHRRRGVWQRRFWEHTIRNEDDLGRHIRYIHWNQVHHDLVRHPWEWPWSTYHRYEREGRYEGLRYIAEIDDAGQP